MTDGPSFPAQRKGRILTPEAPGLRQLEAILQAGLQIRARQSAESPVAAGEGPAHILACETSGSSGRQKVILRRAASWLASFAVTRRSHGVGPGDRYAALGSLGHSISLYAMLEGRTLGADLALLHGMSPRRQAQALRDLDVTTLYATPTQLRLLWLGARAAGIEALPKLRLVVMGGGPCPATLWDWTARLCPAATLRHFYGTSETSFISWSDAATPAGSVGRAYPGVDLKLDESGLIWVSSPYLFEGYEGDNAPKPQWKGRFLATGEIGRMDALGCLFLRGRADRMVTVADKNVFLDEVEAVLSEDPEVTLCAVIGQPDTRRGHSLICVVQGTDSPGTEQRLRRLCRQALGPEAVPHRIVFVDGIPLLPAGKPDLVRLARQMDTL